MSVLFLSDFSIEQKFSSKNIEETKFCSVLVINNNVGFHVPACMSLPLVSCEDNPVSFPRPPQIKKTLWSLPHSLVHFQPL